MSSAEAITFNSFVRERVSRAEDVRLVVSLAAAIAVSDTLSLPQGKLLELEAYYSNNLIYRVETYFDALNEELIIDLDVARKVARSFWMIRAYAQQGYADKVILAKGTNTFIEKFLNVQMYLSEDIVTFLNTNSEVMAVVVNRIRPMVNKLASIEQP